MSGSIAQRDHVPGKYSAVLANPNPSLLPPNGMVVVQDPTDASILVSDCHFAESRTAVFEVRQILLLPSGLVGLLSSMTVK